MCIHKFDIKFKDGFYTLIYFLKEAIVAEYCYFIILLKKKDKTSKNVIVFY